MSYPSSSLGSGFDVSRFATGGGGSSGSGSVSGAILSGQEKVTMQNLNDRLASYLEKVRSLESANTKLEQQIRDWYQKQTPVVRDYSKYEAVVNQMRQKVIQVLMWTIKKPEVFEFKSQCISNVLLGKTWCCGAWNPSPGILLNLIPFADSFIPAGTDAFLPPPTRSALPPRTTPG